MSEINRTTVNGKAKPMVYVAGYLLSAGLTLAAYLMVTNHVSTRDIIAGSIAGLAFIQFIVQLLFFLRLGRDPRPRFKLIVFFSMVIIVAILVGGTLWIMNNLNYRTMPSPTTINQYLNDQQGL